MIEKVPDPSQRLDWAPRLVVIKGQGIRSFFQVARDCQASL